MSGRVVCTAGFSVLGDASISTTCNLYFEDRKLEGELVEVEELVFRCSTFSLEDVTWRFGDILFDAREVDAYVGDGAELVLDSTTITSSSSSIITGLSFSELSWEIERSSLHIKEMLNKIHNEWFLVLDYVFQAGLRNGAQKGTVHGQNSIGEIESASGNHSENEPVRWKMHFTFFDCYKSIVEYILFFGKFIL